MNMKMTFIKTVRITVAIFALFLIVGVLVQAIPFTIVFVGGLVGIAVEVSLTSADFYVWILTSLFVVAMYVYITIKLVPYIWSVISGVGKHKVVRKEWISDTPTGIAKKHKSKKDAK